MPNSFVSPRDYVLRDKLKSGNYPCPICQPDQRRDQNALAVRYEGEIMLLHCHKGGCNYRDIAERLGMLEGVAPRGGSHSHKGDSLKFALEIWGKSLSIENTRAQAYLEARGITAPYPSSLRYIPKLKHSPTGGEYPALIGRFSNGAIHRIYLAQTGIPRKAEIEPNKMALGETKGAHISIRKGTRSLIVAEGIEDALSIARLTTDEPSAVWVCLSATQAEGIALPPHAQGELLIALDNDQAGNASAEKLARRARTIGWRPKRLTPPNGKDWNDYLLKELTT